MRSTTRLLAAALLVLTLVGCSSSENEDADDPTATEAGEDASNTSTEPDDGTTTTGAGAGGGDEADYVEALTAGLAAQGEESQLLVTPDQAECVAPEWIDIITVEALDSTDVAPADLDDPDFSYTGLGLTVDQGTALIDSAMSCEVDLVGQFGDYVTQDVDDTQAACLEGELDDDLVERFLAESLVSEELPVDLKAEFDEIGATCGLQG